MLYFVFNYAIGSEIPILIFNSLKSDFEHFLNKVSI